MKKLKKTIDKIVKFFNSKVPIYKSENAVALAMAVYILIVFVILGIVMAGMMISLSTSSRQEVAAMKAYYVAQAGIEYDLNQLKTVYDWSARQDYTKSFTSSPNSSNYPTFTINYNYPLVAAWNMDGDYRDQHSFYIGAWRFDEGSGTTAYDATHNQNHGTLLNGPTWVTSRSDKFRYALEFDGVNDYVRIPHNATLSDEVFGSNYDFTIEAWVYPTAWVNYSTIINKATGGNWSNSTNGLWSYSGGLRCIMGCNVSGNPSGSYITVTHQPSLDQWHYIACVADETNLIMYVNGKEVGRAAISNITHPRSSNTAPITIGRRSEGSNESFPGKIDEVRILSTGLTASQIAERYRNYVVGFVEDATGNENHGYRYNMDLMDSLVPGQNEKFGNALEFDGVNDYVEVPDSSSLSLTNYTFAAWVNNAEEGSHDYIAILAKGHTTNENYGIFIHYGQRHLHHVLTVDGTRYSFNTSNGIVPLGNWFHVVGTFDGNVAKTFLNGEEVASLNVSGNATSNDSAFQIGRRGTHHYFNGYIDDVRIYNIALGPDEVANLYDEDIEDRQPKPVNVKQYNIITSKGEVEESFTGIIQRQTKITVPQID